MRTTTQSSVSALALACLLTTAIISTVHAEQATPGYNHKMPERIMTPDKLKTRLGTLEFHDGQPTPATIDKLYDNLDLMRGVESFLNGIPAASMEAIRRGLLALGADSSSKVIITEQLLDSNPILLTGNTDTVYAFAMLDLKKDGATVIEIPPKCGPGTVDDAYFRFVVDMGVPGPDRGAGGKYLILPPDYQGELNPPVGGMEAEVDGQKYFVAKSTSYVNFIALRGFLVDGKTDAAVAMFKGGLKIYPLAMVNAASTPPAMSFINGSKTTVNTIHANNFEFYEELHAVIAREPVAMLDPELRGLFAAIGIQKGKPFAPDARMKKLLTEAAAIGNATARGIMFKPRLEGVYYYRDSTWATAVAGGSYAWLKDGGEGGRNLDARTLMFYQATLNTPAMVAKMVGKGSQYAYGTRDKIGAYLDGGKTYKLTLPANVPAVNFWSVVAYDTQTRSLLQTSQAFPSKNNKRDKLVYNADGSIELYFGPKAPAGKETNWTQTVSGKGWYAILRLYGPLEPWFDKTWRPGEFELLK